MVCVNIAVGAVGDIVLATDDARYELLFAPQGDMLAAARACEAAVFHQVYGNTKADFDDEYGPYESASHFIALADRDGDVVGTCRLIVPSPAGLKTVNDVSRPPWNIDGARAVRAVGCDLDATWDVATLAVRKDRPVTPLAAAALYHGMLQAGRVNNVRWVVMMIDERPRRLLAMAGLVARAIPGTAPAPYLGSPASSPLVGDVAKMMDAQRQDNPEGYRLITLGIGLTGISVPPPSAFVLSPAGSGSSLDDPSELARTA